MNCGSERERDAGALARSTMSFQVQVAMSRPKSAKAARASAMYAVSPEVRDPLKSPSCPVNFTSHMPV